MRFFALAARLGHDPPTVSLPSLLRASSRALRGRRAGGVLCAALALAACAPGRQGKGASDAGDEQRLGEAVVRLRAERRLRERRIRELEHQLAARALAAEPAAPPLPVEVLAPSEPEPGEALMPAPLGEASEAGPGERVVGIADDGSEIVYVDDAALGRVVQPSAEALAAVGRPSRSRPSRGASSTDVAEGSPLDGAGHDRIAPLDETEIEAPAPRSKLGRRAARARGSRVAVPPLPLARPAATAPGAASPSPASSPASVGAAAPVVALAPAPPRPRPPRQAPPVRSAPADEHYRSAIALVRSAAYPEAIVRLREFVQRFPHHDYADNAQYWLGEAYYAQRQYDQALAELRLVGERYPGGNKVPDALLKVGYCHLAMGDRESAAAALRELVRAYPRSEPAALAARKLEEVSE